MDKISEREYISPTQCAILIGVSRRTLYRLLEANKIPCCHFQGCTRIRRKDVESLFGNSTEYIKREKKQAEPIEEFYTTKEILEKYGISNSWLLKLAKERNILKTVVRGKTLWSRKHIDKAIADKQPTETATEDWYSVEEVCAKFNMSKEAVYRFVSEQWLKAAGITKRITFHRFQDTYATLQLAAGTDIYTVCKMLDHANVTTTQIYARLVDSTKRDTVNRIKLKQIYISKFISPKLLYFKIHC